MRTDRTGPLRVGQVLIGLLDDVSELDGAQADADADPDSWLAGAIVPRQVEPDRDRRLNLLERMMAAAERGFDTGE